MVSSQYTRRNKKAHQEDYTEKESVAYNLRLTKRERETDDEKGANDAAADDD